MEKPLVSIILPAYNEEVLIERNIGILYKYLETLPKKFLWEILVVNDGSQDKTGEIAEKLKDSYSNLRVFHHKVNRNLGTALRTGFKNSLGDYVIVMDIDLS